MLFAQILILELACLTWGLLTWYQNHSHNPLFIMWMLSVSTHSYILLKEIWHCMPLWQLRQYVQAGNNESTCIVIISWNFKISFCSSFYPSVFWKCFYKYNNKDGMDVNCTKINICLNSNGWLIEQNYTSLDDKAITFRFCSSCNY